MNRFYKRVLINFRNHFLLFNRFSSNTCKENVRVRFAPSPTGNIHLGGLRTALYNHLFAKSKNGTTILRIEDTDQSRKVENAVENIIDDLKWCGITFDEGPYYQSERKELYMKYAKELVQGEKAYYCFCSQTRLDLLKKKLLSAGEIVKYDNKCRNLSKEEVENKLKSESYCIRFKLDDSIQEFDDLIYGKYHCNLLQNEGDPVILKSDGFPTYHFANVVDDHSMNITHVLRGSEWLISTIKHILIFKAFKWDPPKYGHLPLLINSNGTKFSKRQNDCHVGYFRKNCIYPNALINLVIKAGGGFNLDSAERDERNFSLDELAERFNIGKINKYPSKLPIERILECNALEIKMMLESEKGTKILLKDIKDCINDYFNKSGSNADVIIEDEYVLRVLEVVKTRIHKIEDIISSEYKFMWILPNYKFEDGETLTSPKLKCLIDQLPNVNWSKESLNAFFKDFAKSQDIKYKELMGTLRLVLTSFKDGPSVTEILTLLGMDNSIYRLNKSLTN